MPQIIPSVIPYCMDVKMRIIEFYSVQYRSVETETLSVMPPVLSIYCLQKGQQYPLLSTDCPYQVYRTQKQTALQKFYVDFTGLQCYNLFAGTMLLQGNPAGNFLRL